MEFPGGGGGSAAAARSLGARVPTEEAPGEEPPRPVIHNDRARGTGWRPRDAETTIVESAESLRDLGLL
ncbi:NADPH-dependent methylglyoxal reductase (D-lactaldehyde dehydrogenase) [[Actinomadura] parvosata subsp. kistnae]|nr:NADPH-dependent methylglyoxal reductase (D-lactaldehyde dehydrogenase) [Actinomadura parvosata subsp. kistnae]